MPRTPPLRCQLCGSTHKGELVHGDLVRPAIAELIRRDHPEWDPAGFLCLTDLNHYRSRHVAELLAEEKGELGAVEEAVVRGLRERELLSVDTNLELDRTASFGQRMADRIATFGGSWGFILVFSGVMAVWILTNTVLLLRQPFDPYPFILLNLVLSCLAALQAPVIMMSQNRQEARDRLRAENDYRINLKAELEIRMLSERIDRLLTHQWQRLLEIQQIQVDLMAQLDEGRTGSGKRPRP